VSVLCRQLSLGVVFVIVWWFWLLLCGDCVYCVGCVCYFVGVCLLLSGVVFVIVWGLCLLFCGGCVYYKHLSILFGCLDLIYIV